MEKTLETRIDEMAKALAKRFAEKFKNELFAELAKDDLLKNTSTSKTTKTTKTTTSVVAGCGSSITRYGGCGSSPVYKYSGGCGSSSNGGC